MVCWQAALQVYLVPPVEESSQWHFKLGTTSGTAALELMHYRHLGTQLHYASFATVLVDTHHYRHSLSETVRGHTGRVG